MSPISVIMSADPAKLGVMGQATDAANLPSLPLALVCVGGGAGGSNFVFSAIILWNPMPTPSITANRIAHPIAPFLMALGPPLTANAPPVKNPAIMAFQGSSFFRTPFTAQSNVLNKPPQTPKFPPRTGARALIAVMAVESGQHAYLHQKLHNLVVSFLVIVIPPIRLSPYGLFRKPFTPCHTAPPIACRIDQSFVLSWCIISVSFCAPTYTHTESASKI